MSSNGLDTATVLKILLGLVAAVIAFVVLGSLLRFLGRLIWLGVGLLVLAVLTLLAIRLVRDLL